jgi:hypothetical protein
VVESRSSIQASLATAAKGPEEADVLASAVESGFVWFPVGIWGPWWTVGRGPMQMFRIALGEAWPFLVGLLFLGWGILGFVSK